MFHSICFGSWAVSFFLHTFIDKKLCNGSEIKFNLYETNITDCNNKESKINDYYDKGLLKIANPRKIKLENYLDAFKAIKERKSIGKLCLITEKYK